MNDDGRVLIVGFGNVLRGDDGFGAAVIAALEGERRLTASSRAIDVGIGGLGLVRELLDGYAGLIIVDAVDRGGAPGTVYVLDVKVPDVEALPESERHALAVDMHAAVPDRALLVAAAAGVLPARVCLVGCQPAVIEDFCTELSPPVRAAVSRAADAVQTMIARWTAEAVRG